MADRGGSAFPAWCGSALLALAALAMPATVVAAELLAHRPNIVPGLEVTTWYSILVSMGTPPDAVERLNHELGRDIALPDVRERLIGIGRVPETGTAPPLAGNIRAEVARGGPIVEAAGIAQE